MRFRIQKNHWIDFLFPVALFCMFAVSALTVILLATNIYHSTTEHASLNYTAGTSMSYIREKIHQGDEDGNISIGTFDGNDALIIKQEYNQETYFTYLYADQGYLKELFIKDGVTADVSAGKAILPTRSFSMNQIGKHTFTFTCVDEKDQEASCVVSTHSTSR